MIEPLRFCVQCLFSSSVCNSTWKYTMDSRAKQLHAHTLALPTLQCADPILFAYMWSVYTGEMRTNTHALWFFLSHTILYFSYYVVMNWCGGSFVHFAHASFNLFGDGDWASVWVYCECADTNTNTFLCTQHHFDWIWTRFSILLIRINGTQI